jgi:hypothetical protein
MKSKLVYLATIALMASGMAMAQSTAAPQSGSSTPAKTSMGAHTDASGDLPGAKEDESQSGTSTQSNSSDMRPGATGTPSTPDQGTSPKGTNPATGVGEQQKGTADTNEALPATDPAPPKN